MTAPLHMHCECGAYANGNGAAAEAVMAMVDIHVGKGHVVKTWRRGWRSKAVTHFDPEAKVEA